MAEAMPEMGSWIPKRKSILFLTTRWQFDPYGMSTVTRSLVENLRVVDPVDSDNPGGKVFQIHCAVLEEDDKIPDADVKDAEQLGVKLFGAKPPRGGKETPDLNWMDPYVVSYYRYLVTVHNYDVIVGHAPYIANGCLNLREFCRERGTQPRVTLIFHGLPKDGEYVDDNKLFDWLENADHLFSVGQSMYMEVDSYIAGPKPSHGVYIPAFPVELFQVQKRVRETKATTTQNVVMMTGEGNDMRVCGLDFPKAVRSTLECAQRMRECEGVRMNLNLLTAEPVSDAWREEFHKVSESTDYKQAGLTFKCTSPEDLRSVKSQMQRSHLFLLPLEPASPLFGTEALCAAGAGVPILVSKYSGIATLLQKMGADGDTVVSEGDKAEDWKARSIRRLTNPDQSQQQADWLRIQLLLDTSIAASHLEFVRVMSGELCVPLDIDLELLPCLTKQHKEAAARFGIDPISNDVINPLKYVTGFINKLIRQKQKLDKGLLADRLTNDVGRKWQELLSTLEEKNRKVLEAKIGSLHFTMFCPTSESERQMKLQVWRETMLKRLRAFIRSLGMRVERLGPLPPTSDDEPPEQTGDPSEGDDSSGGTFSDYGTSSDVTEAQHQRFVQNWVERQHSHDRDCGGPEDTRLTLEREFVLKQDAPSQELCSLAVSASGAIAVTPMWTPGISVSYPESPEMHADFMSGDRFYFSLLFLKNSADDEELAAASAQNNIIELWDVGNQTFRKVYSPKSGQSKLMNLCKIDDETVAYAPAFWSEENNQIYILHTTSSKWTVSGTVTPDLRDVTRAVRPNPYEEGIGTFFSDMCYLRTPDGTACFILASSKSVCAVELAGSRTRWETGSHMQWVPIGVCAERQSSYVFVCDLGGKIHVLSSEDGALVTSMGVLQEGECLVEVTPVCIHLRGRFLYVGLWKKRKFIARKYPCPFLMDIS